MGKRILILQGHPDPHARHFCHALAEAYADGARAAGHTVETCEIAQLDFPLLRSKADWDDGPTPDSLKPVQEAILRAEHLVFVFPLWLGGMPALLKGFLEQVARPGFALSKMDGQGFPKKLLAGRSARLVVTMACRRWRTVSSSAPTASRRWKETSSGSWALPRSMKR